MSQENRFRSSAVARECYRITESRWRVSLTFSSGSHRLDKHFANEKSRNLIARTSRRRSFQSEIRKTSRHKIGTRASSNGCTIFRMKRNCWKKFDAPQKHG